MSNILSFTEKKVEKDAEKLEIENLEIAQDMMNLMRDEKNLTERVVHIVGQLGVTDKGNPVFCHSEDVNYENALRKQLNKKHRHHLTLVG